ncbi:Nucleotide-binding universal stress protein, UspA family [Streptoalloteichus tenebrarius]|uniref:Nucleotide-binding universal stress protein, UspA family n=1 Tax=Streptoalloteichus tenebrarius (strain ATCC 17920 / DSM 40477 / JCM 4838 / CBS 697.72 / NBRC 16177 / NCIMB 11028 / NRRL B-12390 / A12253. 1 / ISP 5477) TaxID=1933 RepID=A0ABT1HQH6_STRSD|nr:universal stress protein [Streptoalloteichus tenebrarius]MCP2257764.1 Nucleotide-binding universal stress protein, UspA family [Streptoalloteichus tenebrarius]
MSAPAHGAVVVGFDGSEVSRQAALWAAAEADSRRRPLHLLHAFHWPVVELMRLRLPAGVVAEEPVREWVEGAVADVADQCRLARPGLEVTTGIVPGDPVEVLAAASAHAELVVVGHTGLTAAERVLLGSTAAELVRHATCPVIVLRPGTTPPTEVPGQRVVVGVDGSEVSQRAIEFGFDFASRHGHELVAVHAWADLPLDALAPVRVWDFNWEEVRSEAQELLSTSLAGFQERYPDVPLRRLVTTERPVDALLEAAHGAHGPLDAEGAEGIGAAGGAALLVVGSHGRGALGRALLGSVSHAVLNRADCPVAVLRHT